MLRKCGSFGVFSTYVLYLDGREIMMVMLGDVVFILVV